MGDPGTNWKQLTGQGTSGGILILSLCSSKRSTYSILVEILLNTYKEKDKM